MPTAVVCPKCHTNNAWNNKYKQGVIFNCIACPTRLQQVTCPHCSGSNAWPNPTTSAEGRLINCVSCFESFQFVCCPHCQKINMWEDANYEQALVYNCVACTRPFQQINCIYCYQSNNYPTAACIQGRRLTCGSCDKMYQYIRCPRCHLGQAWEKSNYTQGSIAQCWSCEHNFVFVCCPHCKKANFWKNPLNNPPSFVCCECKKDMSAAVSHLKLPIRETSISKDDKSLDPLHGFEKSRINLNLHQPSGRTAPMIHAYTDAAARRGPRAPSPYPKERIPCDYFSECKEFVKQLNWHISYFNMKHNHCYCSKCYPDRLSDTLHVAGAEYVVPRGWAGFGLGVDPYRGDNLWDTWIVVYHGTTAIAAQSILAHRQFLLPGDHLIDGTMLKIRPGHIPGQKFIYTSPSIRYASLDAYSPTYPFKSPKTGKRYNAQIVLQCKQKPDTFKTQEETVGWGNKRICDIIPNDRIEHFTNRRSTVVPYRLLIRLEDA